MKAERLSFFLGRLLYAGFLLLSSVYCILAFIPFTYQQVHVGGLLPWLTKFVHIQPYLYWAALAVLVPTMVGALKQPRSKSLAIGFWVMSVAAGAGLVLHPVLANLTNTASSLWWAAAWLAPLPWIAVCDWLANGATLQWSDKETDEDGRVFGSAWRSALFLTALYAVVVGVHGALAHSMRLTARQWAWSLDWSLLSHLLLFMGIFVVLSLLTAVADWFPNKRVSELIAAALFAAGLTWLVFRSLVFPPLSFRGARADLIAAALAIALVGYSTGISVSLYRRSDGPIESGLALLLWPARFLYNLPPVLRLVFFAALAEATYWMATASAMLDWEYLVQKLVAVFVWTVTFAAFYAIVPAGEEKKYPLWRYVTAGVVLMAYVGLLRAEPRRQEQAGIPASDVAGLVDEYANYDVSFRLADELISRPAVETAGTDTNGAFYTFLAENTHISRSRYVAPVDINLVSKFQQAPDKPNIFLFVIDSLRRDYLGAYNPAVNFTPAFDRFARESVVMQNAFTHYGGTGLSEPSIWVGGMMLHKEYVTPFEPMNTLKKLVDGEGYDAYVSKDTILQTVLGPSPEIHELDANVGTMYYDFCRTLDEVAQTIPKRDATKPMFVYTQPQNIHVSVIDRQDRSVPPGEKYPAGFNPPYASRVKRMDGCFGQFIESLKKAGMYDNSVIIVTADHGDSLGERGRWGHAYAIFPEILRVPLILHLPAAMAKLAYDANAVAFLTDITPTLYYLLGNKPANDPMYGRPLFTASLAEQEAYQRNSYLVVSSYAPVYGILSRDGKSLYIADGVNYREYFYDLGADGRGVTRPITPELREREQALIREQVGEIAKFYHLR